MEPFSLLMEVTVSMMLLNSSLILYLTRKFMSSCTLVREESGSTVL